MLLAVVDNKNLNSESICSLNPFQVALKDHRSIRSSLEAQKLMLHITYLSSLSYTITIFFDRIRNCWTMGNKTLPLQSNNTMKILAKPLLSGPGVFRANNLGIAKTIKSLQRTSWCGKSQIAKTIKLLKHTRHPKWRMNLPENVKIDQYKGSR